MKLSTHVFLCCTLVGNLAVSLTPSFAQTARSRSPFMPQGGSVAAVAPTENAPLELRGVVATANGYLFGLFDPSKRQSFWVKLNDSGPDFTVSGHDVENETVTVEHQGRSLTLAMKTAKIESIGPLPNPGQMNVPRPPNQPAVGVNSTPADEARRLEGVAAEVRRRRMLRAAAQQQGATGQPPQVQPAPPGGQPVPMPAPQR